MRVSLFLLGIFSSILSVQAETPADWPCGQVYNPDISLATIWQGPALGDRVENWWESPYLGGKSKELLALFEDSTLTEQETNQLVAAFAKKIPAKDRNEAMLNLFAAIYSSTVELYREQLKSILHFVKRQGKVSARTSEKASDMRELRREGANSADERYRAVKAEMEWNVRVFDERNRLTPYICEEPALLKQQLGFRARAILAHL